MSDLLIPTEEWIVVVHDQKYVLTSEQAKVLSDEIKKSNRGIIMFSEFAISIPYIQEFYKKEVK